MAKNVAEVFVETLIAADYGVAMRATS